MTPQGGLMSPPDILRMARNALKGGNFWEPYITRFLSPKSYRCMQTTLGL